MPLEKHDLLHELPEHHHTIRHLKMNDKHFENLFERYHLLTNEIYRMESGVETPADKEIENRKIERVQLKDKLFDIIKQTEANI